MRYVLFSILSILIFSNCSTTKSVETRRQNADQYMMQGNYAAALPIYESLITASSKGVAVDGGLIRKASEAAFKTENYSKATSWLDLLTEKNFDDVMLYIQAIEVQGDKAALAQGIEKYGDVLITEMGEEQYNSKLCATYGAIGNDDGVAKCWEKSDAKTRSQWFETYFNHSKSKLDDAQLEKLCDTMLAADPDNTVALHFKAVKLYDKSEARYKKLMADYERNKNAASYAILRRDLKFLSADYRSSRDMFEKLRTINPDNKNHIKYLINIYNRLDQNDKAKQLEKLL